MKLNKTHLALILILIVAAFFRVYRMPANPSGFFCDEASVGYNAYSIIATGRDEWGIKFPVFFRALGEYKNPVMIYSSIPFVYFFGLNEFSVRTVSALYGLAAVFAVYLLAARLFTPRTGLLAALFLAVSPWHIQFSRVNLEGLTPMVFFLVLGTYYWLAFLDSGSRRRFLSSGLAAVLLFAFALYSYFPSRIFTPAYALILLISSWKQIRRNFSLSAIILLASLVLILPLLNHMLFGEGLSRWSQVRGSLVLNDVFTKYLRFFSWDYLFARGDIDFPGQFITRHSVRGMGELYFFQLPLLLAGILYLLRKGNWKQKTVLLSWLLIFPLCDLFTNSPSPYATRTLVGVIPFVIISAIGLNAILALIKNIHIRFVSIVLFQFILLSSIIYYFVLQNRYPYYSSDFWGWQYGAGQIINYFVSQSANYDQMCLEGQFNAPEIFIKFYDPQNKCAYKCQICDFQVFDASKHQLFALSPENYNKISNSGYVFNLQKTIKYVNGSTAFLIGEIYDSNKR